jgi:cellobiose-specific phosphotransferase system component IIB
MSEYLIKNYQMIQNYGEEDLKNGMIEFDAYLVDPKYKEIITKVNPPLSK